MRTEPLLKGALPGALLFLAFCVVQMALNASFELMGQSSDALSDMVLSHYAWPLTRALLILVGAHAGLGALLGWATYWLLGAPRVRTVLAVVGGLQLALWARQIHHLPQAHAAFLFDRGGWRADLQILLTHHVPAWVLDLPLWLAGAAVIYLVLRRIEGKAWGLVAMAAACGLFAFVPPPSAPETKRPNVLIIANDSMRPDRMSWAGHERPTPAIDALAAKAVIFDRASVPIARTFPSWASLLTAQPPHGHGLRHMFPGPQTRLQGVPTVAKSFRDAGYRTAAVADYAGDIFTRLDAGFERVNAPTFDVPSLIRQRCLQMTPGLLPWLRNPLGEWLFPDLRGLPEVPRTGRTFDELIDEIDRPDERPFFIVSFVSASHFPFAAPAPFYKRYADPKYAGPSRYLRYQRLKEEAKVRPEEGAQVQALFDGTLGYFDHHFGRVMAHLKARGLEENTIVVLTADHGENLGEHETIGHGDHLRGSGASRVPLLMRGPKLEPSRIDAVVRSVDLAPTLLAQAGLPPLRLPETPWTGRDLSPLIRGERQDLGLLGYAETGLWFTPGGNQFYFGDRMHYPGIVELAAVRHDEGGDIRMRGDYEDRVALAKHRAVWSREAKVIYVPTPEGVRFEGYRIEGTNERPSEPDPSLLAALRAFLRADGQVELVEDYALPIHPVAEP